MKEFPKVNPFSRHLFEYKAIEKRRLIFTLTITLTVMFLEIAGGRIFNSIALMGDGFHMFTHSFAIGVSLVAISIAKNPPCHHRTYGLYRAEVLTGFVNGLLLILVVVILLLESVKRIIHPQKVLSLQMLIIALIGLGVNLVSILILKGSRKSDLNIKTIFFHMLSDAISSIGIVIGALIIGYTGWNVIDPLITIGIAVLIVIWAWGILRESATILLEMAPSGLNVHIISEDIKAKFPEVSDIHNEHLWSITSDMLVFTCHMEFDPEDRGDYIIPEMNEYLLKNYNIIECTLQTH